MAAAEESAVRGEWRGVRRAEHASQERERIRIAHDLHDGPLQSIISFEMRLQINF